MVSICPTNREQFGAKGSSLATARDHHFACFLVLLPAEALVGACPGGRGVPLSQPGSDTQGL